MERRDPSPAETGMEAERKNHLPRKPEKPHRGLDLPDLKLNRLRAAAFRWLRSMPSHVKKTEMRLKGKVDVVIVRVSQGIVLALAREGAGRGGSGY